MRATQELGRFTRTAYLAMSNRTLAAVFCGLTLGVFAALPAAATAAAAAATPSASPTPTPSPTPGPPYGNMNWREIGPATAGGRVAAVAGSATDPKLYYIGSGGGGVWKSSNSGQTWDAVFAKEAVAAIGAVTIDPTDNNTVWVGTGEDNPRNDVSYGNGIYKTDRRRRSLGQHGSGRDQTDFAYRGRSAQSQSRRRCSPRRSLQRRSRPRRVCDRRRREDLEEDAVHRSRDRRVGPRDGSAESQRDLRGHVAISAPSVDVRQRRRYRRPLQIDRRR